ncbi:hypothetical protein LJC46_04980 [Desulfovibrio sp. OttesenSCG-928-G15]|nr:hypothetical protein [Desulfovibrio sp. OttesenSCG-928-G15]
MNRFFSTFFAVFFFFTTSAFADPYESRAVEGQEAVNLLTMLANSGWIADGNDSGKYVYVLFEPKNTFCLRQYDDSRPFIDSVQFRWVPVDFTGEFDKLYDAPEKLGEVLRGSAALPEQSEHAARNAQIRQYTLGGVLFYSMTRDLNDENTSSLVFPTLVYGTGEKASIVHGVPQDMANFLTFVPTNDAFRESFIPMAYQRAEEAVRMLPVKNMLYMNSAEQPAPVLQMPFTDAPRLGSILPGQSDIPAIGITENGFVVLSFDGKTPHIYVEDAVFTAAVREKEEAGLEKAPQ